MQILAVIVHLQYTLLTEIVGELKLNTCLHSKNIYIYVCHTLNQIIKSFSSVRAQRTTNSLFNLPEIISR